ncbi:polysaccharide biosynthesis C-terminal domain-containing protein [Chitinophaga vietnamensis]|uniref:polysaccharide biosynthesis C-terminal domain-containing protein n=1 Tax=Chitinophaga vietnamensis TaxID=2593957 RepID=UPI001177E8D3|nr:NAD-dependent epimerase/dehydratase family protein [Chitinophaga vietnamensis]
MDVIKVVVTGAKGFVGKNLTAHLKQLKDIELHEITRATPVADYAGILKDAAVVYHLGGANRPVHTDEFHTDNTLLTAQVLEHLKNSTRPAKIIISSSAQATMDNPYGKSKLAAEELATKFVAGTPHEVVLYRLPGIFGKWCKPNYNSVVATFCYNVARDIPLEVRDPDYQVTLSYVDDVISSFLEHLRTLVRQGQSSFDEVATRFTVSLGKLATIITSFKTSRESLQLPINGDTLTKYLYSTYLSYLPDDKFSYAMKLNVDNRGGLFEWIKHEAMGQVFVSSTHPGITRGNHFHHTKTEKFLVIKGEAVIRFRKIDEDKVIEYPVNGDQPHVVDIPPGYTHNITNTGNTELITLFWANEIFDQNRPDTYFLQV